MVEFDPDGSYTHFSLTPGSVDDQVPSEDGCGSAIGSEEDVASIMDKVFDLEQTGEVLTSASISETAPPVAISGENAP
jgi:hypothetical protein